MTVMSKPATQSLEAADLARLVQSHQASLWRYVRYLGAAATEADDLVQETFLALFRSGFNEKSKAETSSYLRTAIRLQLLMLRRHQSRQPEAAELEVAEQVWADTFADTKSENGYLGALDDCVDQLDGRAAQAIRLQYHQRASRSEMAKQLKMKSEGVKTLLRRTRDALRNCIERKLKDKP